MSLEVCSCLGVSVVVLHVSLDACLCLSRDRRLAVGEV